jgi:hypothetical protein
MNTQLASAVREDLPATYRSTFDDHCSKSSYAFLTVCPTSRDLTLTDEDVQLGCLSRGFNSGLTGRCSCNAPAAPGHDLVCALAGSVRTGKHEYIKGCAKRAFEESGSVVQCEPPGSWPDTSANPDDTSRPRRADLKITGGASLGISACYIDVSIASCYHTTRVQSLKSALDTRHQDKLVRYRGVFSNFYPLVLSPNGSFHHRTKPIFAALKACGVDVVALKHSMAFGLLRLRSRAYNTIYDAIRVPRSDVDHTLSPPPRSSVRTACARAQVAFGSPPPAPVSRPMDTG